MVRSQEALIQACKDLGLEYDIIHEDEISVKVRAGKYNLYYTHWYNPYNRADVKRIVKDKDLSYTILSDVIEIPKWRAFIDPDISSTYPNYANMGTVRPYKEIMSIIKDNFTYPLIIKPNMKSMGIHVAEVNDESGVMRALKTVFDAENRKYDYIAIAQEKIDIAHEYRVITFRSDIILAYEKSTKDAKFKGNLSPLHWDGGKAIHITDASLLKSFEDFCKPVHNVLDLEYGGFDIAIDKNGKIWMIEINGNPAVGHFIEDCGLEPIVEMNQRILSRMIQD